MTLKSLLAGTAIAALAMMTSSAGALAADPYGSQANTPSTSTTGNMPAETTPGTPRSDDGQMNGVDSSTTRAQSNGVSLATVANPKKTLANAQLQDKAGQTVGTVRQVVLGSNGKVKNVYIDVNGKTVSVAAAKLKFDKSSKILLTSMTQEQIDALPQAKGI